MLASDHLRGGCPHCGGAIEFPAEAAGMGIECPHCGEAMNLVGAGWGEEERVGEETPAVPGRPTVAELAAAFAGNVERVRPTAAYRWAVWLGAATTLAIPVLYGALVVFLAGMLFRSADNWLGWVRAASGGALAAGFRTGIFLAGMAFGMLVLGFLLRPFFIRPPRRAQPLALSPVSEPLLFSFVHMVCDAVGVARPVRVDVDCRMNASVGFRGGERGWLAGEWVLTLGLPLVAGLDLRQFAGVLAHELGHLGQGWAMRACHLIRGLNGWLDRAAGGGSTDALLDRWAVESGAGVHQGVLSVLRIGVGLSQWVLGSVAFLGRVVNRQLLRQMELNADRVQIQLVGSDVFEATFRRLCVLSEVRREVYRRMRGNGKGGRETPDDLPRAVVARADGVPEETIERWCERRLGRVADYLDAHPSDASRIEQARSLALPGVFRHGCAAEALFSNFDVLAKQVTALHYREDLGIPETTGAGEATR